MKSQKIKLPFRMSSPVLAMGSQAKNTVCFAKSNYAYLSPAHNNLSDPDDFSAFTKTVRGFLKKHPKIIACDMHPEYQSSKFAAKLSAIRYPLSAIQHHHAHAASCMAENGLKNQKVIGVAFDGTGLGDNGDIWGGEFLICNYKKSLRAAHLKEIPLLGQEKAILEPRRLALAWLYQAYQDKLPNLKIGFIKELDKNKWPVFKKMIKSGFNSPLVSSIGRLFDAAGALILEKNYAAYEAELAIELEKLALGVRASGCQDIRVSSYSFKIVESSGVYIIDPAPMFRQIVSALKTKQPKEEIAYKFHLTIAEIIRKTCLLLSKETGLKKVVFSGGVFQNKLLLGLALDLLYKERFQVFTHKRFSCSDSCISLGQAIAAGYGA